MRVLYCTDTYPPQINGVSIVTALSVTGLAQRGWDCAVVAPQYPEETWAAWGDSADPAAGAAELLSLPSAAVTGYPGVRLVYRGRRILDQLIRRFQPDLIHCETEFTLGRMGQRAASAAGLPMVSSYHTDFGGYTEAYGFGWLHPTVSRYLRRFHSRSHRVYTPSTVSQANLQALGVSEVEIWGRGVDTAAFTPHRRTQLLRESLGMGSRFTFAYVGRLAAEKRVDLVLEGYRRASAQVPHGVMHLVIAGTGPCEAELRAAAPPDVTFLGVLDRRTALPDLYANCDAFLFASPTETLGLVVLEAMASGLPVIATPEGGVRDHLRPGVNGLAYTAGDVDGMAHAMVLLAGDWELTHQLADGARRTAEALGWDRELDRLDASYREVCARTIPAAQAARTGKNAVTVVPTPSSLSADTLPP